MVSYIEERLANWTYFPAENGEDIQVLKYIHGQKYGDRESRVLKDFYIIQL